MSNGNTLIACPDLECTCVLPHLELQEILGVAALAQLQQRSLEAAVAADPTLHLCRTPDCSYVTSWASGEAGQTAPRMDCPLCGCCEPVGGCLC